MAKCIVISMHDQEENTPEASTWDPQPNTRIISGPEYETNTVEDLTFIPEQTIETGRFVPASKVMEHYKETNCEI